MVEVVCAAAVEAVRSNRRRSAGRSILDMALTFL
jgi:hypothetical protein